MRMLKWFRISLIVALPLLSIVCVSLGWWGYAGLFFAGWIVYQQFDVGKFRKKSSH